MQALLRHHGTALKWCMSPAVRDAVRVAVLVLLWYTLGTVLSFYNKLLVGKHGSAVFPDPFPAPLFMSGVQFAMQHVIAKFVFQTGLIPRTAEPLSWQDWSKIIIPNGACTGLDIGFSNMSLVFISLSFYTMCKATVPLFLLTFAFIWGIERPTWRLGLVVLIITVGLVLLVSGETEFDAAGFALVMVAACCAGLRFTLTQVFLHGHHGHAACGGPLEILEALTPVMSATVLVLSLVWERLWSVLPDSPYFVSLQHTLLTLLLIFLGAVLAFLLVWTEYQLIKETSALTFMIAGTCKEIVTVLAAVVFMGDAFGWVNAVGLAVVIAGVALFNVYKLQRLKQGKGPAKGAPGRRDQPELELQDSRDKDDAETQPLIASALSGTMDSGAHSPGEGAPAVGAAIGVVVNGGLSTEGLSPRGTAGGAGGGAKQNGAHGSPEAHPFAAAVDRVV